MISLLINSSPKILVYNHRYQDLTEVTRIMPKSIVIKGKPSNPQLKEWFQNGEEVSFIDKKGASYHGKIQDYKPIGDDAVIWVENSRIGLYLRDIVTYFTISKIEPVFVDADSTSPEKVSLKAGDKTFWVNKTILSERVEYFNAMFRSGMYESFAENIDLSLTFSAEELDVLLFVVNSDAYRRLTFEQAQILVEAADKVAASEIADKAKMRIDECMEAIDKEFLNAVRGKNYEKMSELLSQGANINRKFDKFALVDKDAYVHDCPNDTPLTLAVRTGDHRLTEYLLENEADPNVYYKGNTPLMEASFEHDVKLVKLLLEHGADPNSKDGFTLSMIFLGMRDWLLETKSGKNKLLLWCQVNQLLIRHKA